MRDAFLDEVAAAVRSWENQLIGVLEARDEQRRQVQAAMRGLAGAVLQSIDGDTQLSDDGRAVVLTTPAGEPLGDGLAGALESHLALP